MSFVIFSFEAGDYIREDGHIYEFETRGEACRYLLHHFRKRDGTSRDNLYRAPFRIHKAIIRRNTYD